MFELTIVVVLVHLRVVNAHDAVAAVEVGAVEGRRLLWDLLLLLLEVVLLLLQLLDYPGVRACRRHLGGTGRGKHCRRGNGSDLGQWDRGLGKLG